MQTNSGVDVYRQADAARKLKVTRGRIAQMLMSGELHWVDQDGFRYVTAESIRTVQERRNRVRFGKANPA